MGLDSLTLEFVMRILLAGILGAAIGFEREYRSKEAGFRTHFLVALGSALIMIVSQYGFLELRDSEGINFDPSRVAAQVVTGIGFIGAGTIMIQRQFVRGLTTAAGLWATSGIGLAIGSGMYWIGLTTTFITLFIMEITSIFKGLGASTSYIVYSTGIYENVQKITHMIFRKDCHIISYDVKRERESDKDFYRVRITFRIGKKTDETEILAYIQSMDDLLIERIE